MTDNCPESPEIDMTRDSLVALYKNYKIDNNLIFEVDGEAMHRLGEHLDEVRCGERLAREKYDHLRFGHLKFVG